MTIQKLPGSAITPGTITVVQLETTVATTVQTGGGPKLTNIQITDNAYTVLDDTAVDVTGGYITITGTGFVTGCSVIVGQLPAASVTFISSTEVRAQLSAQSAGTYIVYLVNPDGGVGIRVNGVTHSASPAWQTASSLGEQYDGVAISLSLVATDATSYTVTSGSLPPGLSLNSNTGVISGTVSGVANDTLYTFTVRATDAQLQDSPRTFTVTITVSDPYFRLTSLLLSGSAISANTVIRDSSTNNFNMTVSGDARASNFTPYGTGWSVYFDGTGDLLSGTITGGVGSGDFTLEYWVYHNTLTNWQTHFATTRGVTGFNVGTDATGDLVFYDNVGGTGGRRIEVIGAITVNRWYHFAFSRSGTSLRGFLDGTLQGTYTTAQDYSATAFYIGALDTTQEYTNGYISNLRLVKGTALYTANFTPATTNLTTVANTSLLTCNVNRFRDSSANNFAITRNGDARVVSFNPFNITNTGVNGSAYFDGSGDYISLADNAAFNLSSGSFTIEAWVYPISVATNVDLHIMAKYSAWVFWIDDATLKLGFDDNATLYLQSSANAIVLNTWSHVAIVRNTAAPLDALFINGIQVASSSSLRSIPNNSNSVFISGNSSGWPGYISNLRLTKAAVYTGNFTPPAAPLTAIANTQLLTLQYDQPHNNHTFLDSSSNQFVVNRAGNASQGTFSPFSQSGWSVFFDGDGSGSSNTDSISVPDTANLELGSDNFTIECWVFQTAASSVATRILNKSSAILINSDSTGITVDSLSNINTSPYTVTFNAWTHVAVTRSSNTLTIYINGIARGSGVFTGSIADNANAWYIGNDPTSVRAFPGYISNFRMVKGVVVYTTNFTPPTSMLTAITGTTLLVCQSNRLIDNSTNNLTVTRTGDIRVTAFSPFAPTAVYNPAVHGGSAYFDGTGDYLLTTGAPALAIGTSAFTLEGWCYFNNVNTGGAGFGTCATSLDGVSDRGVSLILTGSSGGWYFRVGRSVTGQFEDFTGVTPLITGHWHFFQLIRSSTSANDTRLYLNGVLQATGTSTISINMQKFSVGIYSPSDATVAMLNGYVSSVRFLRGAVSFSIPTTPPQPIDGTIILLNFTDAAILDSTGRTVIETVADAKTSSVVTKFTGGSMSFDGTGDYLAIPAAPWQTLGTSNFTCEWWEYIVAYSSGYFAIIHLGSLGDTGNFSSKLGLRYELSGTRFRIGVAGTSLDFDGLTTATGVWRHCALVRNGNSWNLYQNGVAVGGTITNSSSVAASTSTSIIGAAYFGGGAGALYSNNGYITDLRFTVGQARYTANFTAPTVPARLK